MASWHFRLAVVALFLAISLSSSPAWATVGPKRGANYSVDMPNRGDRPRIAVLSNFVSSRESKQLLDVARQSFAEHGPPADGQAFVSFVTSKNEVQVRLEDRVSELLFADPNQLEPMHLMRLAPGMKIPRHMETIEHRRDLIATGGERKSAVYMFLNENSQGGITFNDGMTIVAEAGKAVVMFVTEANGLRDEQALVSMFSEGTGELWLAILYMRECTLLPRNCSPRSAVHLEVTRQLRDRLASTVLDEMGHTIRVNSTRAPDQTDVDEDGTVPVLVIDKDRFLPYFVLPSSVVEANPREEDFMSWADENQDGELDWGDVRRMMEAGHDRGDEGDAAAMVLRDRWETLFYWLFRRLRLPRADLDVEGAIQFKDFQAIMGLFQPEYSTEQIVDVYDQSTGNHPANHCNASQFVTIMNALFFPSIDERSWREGGCVCDVTESPAGDQ